ncbi:MAG TPA: aspartate kinase [Vicinamibacterales bacterium]|jgi:aspartate kinase|nr:aspartate kinase [Vicinamibacterales bacterium]HVW04992.1 aspartate kinase [Vicinamibacterales bacterium]
MIVMKFGGTSVADQPAIERLMGIVRAARQSSGQPESQDWRGPVVVVSALGGATDKLLRAAADAGEGRVDSALEELRGLRARHLEVAGVIGASPDRPSVDAFINSEFDELDRLVGALGVLKEVTPRWLDAIAAAGEILSSRIVAAALTSHGLAATWVDARKVIVTGDDHTAAPPLMKETAVALSATVDPILADRRIPVIGGFVGANREGVTTTLGRGGSDYSAAIVGACLGSSEIQIWTDVDGMLTADPRLVKHVQVVPHISFGEASELAYFGAKVLHPATILPAVGQNIPVRILNSRRPQDARGTLITRDRPASDRPLTAVASKKGVTVVDITSTRMLMAHGFLARIFQAFEQHRTAVDVVTTSEVSVSVTVDDARRLPEIAAALREVADVTREDKMAILCAVGDGLQRDPAFVGRLLESLGGIPIRMLSQAAARRNITLVIREADLESALERVHERFFGVPV